VLVDLASVAMSLVTSSSDVRDVRLELVARRHGEGEVRVSTDASRPASRSNRGRVRP